MHACAFKEAVQTPNSCFRSTLAISISDSSSYERAQRYSIPQLHLRIPSPLPGRAPDRLEEAVLLCEAVEAVVALAHGAHEAAKGVDLVLAGVAAVLIDLSDAELDGGVVLGLDNASGSRLGGISIANRGLRAGFSGTHAFAGDVDCWIR